MDTVGSILLAVLGIGFLVFIHETGHFLAARGCGVRVHVFSLGFGPRLAGFVKGGCDYRLSLVPVGGYVRMEGELGDPDAGLDGSLATKPALQRVFVYSAGVLMNLAVAFLLFPIVYFVGVPMTRPVLGAVTPGGAAWRAGIAPGALVKSVNGRPVDSFDELHVEVALASSPVRLVLEEPDPEGPGGASMREVLCDTTPEKPSSLPKLGVEPARKLVSFVDAGGHLRRGFPVEVEPGSAADGAGVRSGDLLVEVDSLPAGYAARGAIEEVLDALGGRRASLRFHVPDPKGRSAAQIEALTRGITLEPRPVPGSERVILGVYAAPRVVRDVRPGSAAARLGLRPLDEVLEVDGAPFLRVPGAFRATLASEELAVRVLREGASVALSGPLTPSERLRFWSDVDFDPKTTRAVVVPGLAADRAGIRSGDRFLKIGGKTVDDWSQVQKSIAAASGLATDFELERPLGRETEGFERLTIRVQPSATPSYAFGLRLIEDREPLRAAGPLDACVKGFGASVKLIQQIAFILKKIALGDAPAKEHLGGPISIAAQSYHVAQGGLIQFLYFLGMLSLNLALINILPIPVLDGGNLLFVVVEAVKGSPVSDRVLGASQTVGVFLLIALMVWVTFHDVRRVFGLFS